MKYPVSAPLIGPWLYRRSVKELKSRAEQGDMAAVQSLSGIFCTSHDETVREIARTSLCSLTSVPAIDTFCTETLERNNPALDSIASENNYLPSDPGTRALFLFVTSQREHYTRLDGTPHRPLLASGYAQATHRVRSHTRSAAKKNGQLPVLAAALMGTGQNRNAAAWPEEDWEVVTGGLIYEQDWKGLWRLVVHAPVHLAITALSAMRAAGWTPVGDDRVLWEEIVSAMPGAWNYPVPEDAAALISLSPDSQPLRLAFSTDGTLLAAGCADGTVYLWNTRAGTLIFRLHERQDTNSRLVISSDNTRLLCAGTGGELQCRETITGTLLWSVASDEQAQVPVSCSHDRIVVIPRSARGHLRIVNLADEQVQDIAGGHEAVVTCCALSDNGRFCAVGHVDGAVGLWDLQKNRYLQTLEGLGDPVISLSFCEDKNEILVIHERNQPTRWRITSGERIRTYTGNAGPARGCAITPGGSSFAIAGDDRMLRLWQAGNAAPVAEIPLYNRPLTVCAASADGRLLVTGCTDGTLRTYAMNGGTVLRECKAHKQSITAIALSSHGDMIASAGGDGAVKLWNCTSGELIRTLLQPAGGVTGITATPDSATIFAGYRDGTARQISHGTGTFNRTLEMYTSTVRAIAISPDGTLLACAGGDTTLRCWNSETGGLVTGIEGLTTTQRCLVFSPDGKMLISGGWDGNVRIWSMPDGHHLKTLAGHTSNITALAIAPDCTMLATGSNDRSVRLWTLVDDQCVSVREDFRSEVSALAISPDGALIAFAGADAIIHVCQLPGGEPAAAIPALPGKITGLAFAGDGRVLVAGFDTGNVAIFSCSGQHLLRTVPAHTAAVTGIVALNGGESILTSSLDGQVRRQDLPWTRHLSGTTLDDIPLVSGYERTCARAETRAQWAFLHHMLAARFTNDIELCATVSDDSMYDIQIVG